MNDEQQKKVFLTLLREMRMSAGFRQEDVAKHLGLPQSAVSKYESGERRLDILEVRTICNLFGVGLAEFVARLETQLKAGDDEGQR